uniref:Plastid lipid-associated protein/fibrillin conserved domain-containing protein n=1 Tax=Alexandrium andersonii TaxID=327968 RepID=A0A7S2F7H4_9DINO|mmetsp:Transcript_1907/g.4198  ORF Transcript_1907/g.4198 Transcript_1907/m.4198 type:complete len:220 (+) Transcript_1907:97-756(+)
MASRVLTAIWLPLAVHTLRIPGSQWSLEPLRDALQEQLGSLLKDASRRSRKDLSLLREATDAGGPVSVKWSISYVEPGTKVLPSFGEACSANGNLTGTCSIPRAGGGATLGLLGLTSRPLDDEARVKVTARARILTSEYTTTADCAMCGEGCRIKLPMYGQATLPMPHCPPPPRGFNVTAEGLDFSEVPAHLHGHVRLTSEFFRGDGSRVAHADAHFSI